MSSDPTSTILQRSASEPSKPPEPGSAPKRTFTLPTGEPVTVVQAPAMQSPIPPVSADDAPKLMTVVEPVSPVLSPASVPPAEEPKKAVVAAEETPETVVKDATSAEAIVPKKVEPEIKDILSTPVVEQSKTLEKIKPVEENPVTPAPTPVAVIQPSDIPDPPKMVLVPAATMPISTSPSEPVKAILVPSTSMPIMETAEPVKIVPVQEAPLAAVPIVATPLPVVSAEAKKVEIVEKPAMLVEKRSSMPMIMPSMQVVEETIQKPAPMPVLVPVPVQQTMPAEEYRPIPAAPAPFSTTRYTCTLEPLKRRIAIFNSYVALSSTILRFSDKYHHELLDEAGHPIFHLQNRHYLSDEHGVLLACLHKSLWLGRWHVESMKHQTRLLTARRKQGDQSMRVLIHNCFTDRTEELLYLRGKLYDGMDPTINKVAVLFDGDGVVQVAKGFDAGIAAVLAFVTTAWDWNGSQICCV